MRVKTLWWAKDLYAGISLVEEYEQAHCLTRNNAIN
jgi:hypothetical protein